MGSLPVMLTEIPQKGDPFGMYDTMLIIIGVSLVLAILVLMTLIIMAEGKIFQAIDNKKKGKKKETKAPAAKKSPAPAAKAAAPAAPYVEPGVPPQVVAAIAAAVASMEGGKFELRSVTRAKGAQSTWNMAGTISYTEPF